MNRFTKALRVSSASIAGLLVFSASGIPLTVGAASPGMVTNVMATAGDGQAQVTWTAPADNGGSTITNYAIWAQPDPNTTVQGVMSETPDASTSITVTGLTNAVYYTFTVIAFNGAWGSWSGYSAWVLPGSTTPPPPDCASDITALRLAADYGLTQYPPASDPNTWFFAIFIKGLIDLYRLTGDAKYLTAATTWANHNNWLLPTNAPNLDGPEASQEYIDLYELDPTHPAKDIADAQAYVTRETARVEGGNVGDMSYVDAVRLGALSAFARLGVPNNNPTEIDAMAKMFAHTEATIYDKSASLWWRDSRWAGTTVHWSRGNGWIVLALTDTIAALPASDPHRAHYISLLNAMAAVLKTNQQAGGYWTADIANPASFPSAEESGTAFFTYGLSRGITMGYLDKATYGPVVQKAWGWLKGTALHSNGLVGYVQGPSSHPSQFQPISPTATSNYGVGGFLFAGVRQAMLNGC